MARSRCSSGPTTAVIGALLLNDPIRSDAARTIRTLRRSGVDRVVMVTGDRADVAEAVAAIADVDEVFADRSPADKVEIVRLERRNGPTIMVGDGINDAPALAVADVGVAIGGPGATASSEVADVVLTVDRLDRLGDALRISPGARFGSPGRVSSSAWASPCSRWVLLPPGGCRQRGGRSSRRASTSW